MSAMGGVMLLGCRIILDISKTCWLTMYCSIYTCTMITGAFKDNTECERISDKAQFIMDIVEDVKKK